MVKVGKSGGAKLDPEKILRGMCGSWIAVVFSVFTPPSSHLPEIYSAQCYYLGHFLPGIGAYVYLLPAYQDHGGSKIVEEGRKLSNHRLFGDHHYSQQISPCHTLYK